MVNVGKYTIHEWILWERLLSSGNQFIGTGFLARHQLLWISWTPTSTPRGTNPCPTKREKEVRKCLFWICLGDMLVFEEDRDLMESHFLLFGCYFWNICCLYFNEVSLLILILLIGGDAAMLVISCHQWVVQLCVQLCRCDLLLRYRLPDYNTASLQMSLDRGFWKT